MFQSADMVLSPVALDFTTQSYSIIKWMRDEYNLVILSRFYAEPPQLVHVIETFSRLTWILIITSIINGMETQFCTNFVANFQI